MVKIITIGCLLLCMLPAGRVDVCIDPGHGGVDPGCVNPRFGVNGPYEKDFNLYIALVMADDLYWLLGYTVSMTRFSDVFVSREDRALMANGELPNAWTGQKDTCEYFVSVHNNANEDRTKKGTETYYKRSVDLDYATSVHEGMWNFLMQFAYAENRGVKYANFQVLRETTSPACLVECAFVSHDISAIAQWYQLKDNQGGFKDYAAYGIDDGIDDYAEFERPGWLRISLLPLERATINLSWLECPVSVTGYNIYRRTFPSEDFLQIEYNYPGTSYADDGVSNGGTYEYYVCGRNSSGQEGNRSNIVIAQAPPFATDCSFATGFNNGRRLISDDNGELYMGWTNMDDIWLSKSTDIGNVWSVGVGLDNGWQSAIDTNSLGLLFTCYASTPGLPDTAAGEPQTYTIGYSEFDNGLWTTRTLYETEDTIYGVSFAIDHLDTGWVLFNTSNVEEPNQLKIGKFYTQETQQELEDVIVLDNYARDGKSAIDIRTSDRSLHIAYEKPNGIYYLNRNNAGTWSNPYKIWTGHNPSINIAGDLIHVIWESWYNTIPTYTKIQTSYTNGLFWSRIQDITGAIYGRGCYPFIEKGAVAVWSQYIDSGPVSYWEVYTSQRTLSSSWTTPQNISQSTVNSKHPQAAMYQTVSQTHRTYCWTEGSGSPYSVKTCLLSSTPTSKLYYQAIPLYAFDLGDSKPSIFNTRRQGYTVYGLGFEKSVDYDSSCLRYVITGLDSTKIYEVGLICYQDEEDSIWRQGVEIDSELVQSIDLQRRKVSFIRTVLPPTTYGDGRISVDIRNLAAPKAVLSALAVWEFPGAKIKSLVHQSSQDDSEKFTVSINSNPVKGKLQVSYNLTQSTSVNFKVYSVNGRLIWEETTECKPAGKHLAVWDGKDNKGNKAANGVYFIRLESEYGENSTKIILLR